MAETGSADFLTWSNVGLALTSVIASVAGVFVATLALRVSRAQSEAAQESLRLSNQAIAAQVRSEEQTRRLQTLLNCQQAYKIFEQERLLYKYSVDVNPTTQQIGSLFRTYWTLKSDQMDYWLSGYVDYDTFLSWSMSTVRHFVKGRHENFFGIPFTTGWAHYGRPYHQEMNPLFVRYTDALQYKFRHHNQVDKDDVFYVTAMMKEINTENLTTVDGRPIRKYGSPENLEDFERDLKNLQNNMHHLLKIYLPDPYGMAAYGADLKGLFKLPEAH